MSKNIVSRDIELSIDDLLGGETINPATYQYFKNLKQRRIILNDQVTSDILESVMLPLLEMDNDGTGEPIELILCTVGGSVFDGLPLCNIIDNIRTKLTITVITYAYSMGGLILLAGKNNPNVTKRCYGFSTALLHGGDMVLDGQSSKVKDFYNFNQEYEEEIKKYVITHSNITEEEYNKMERYEWYMSSKTMKEKGLVDYIIGEEK